MARPKKGRPTKLTRDMHDQIVDHVRQGNYIDTAAALCGVTRESITNWVRRGREAKHGVYREFFIAITRAQAETEMRLLALIDGQAAGDWRAAAWRLERIRRSRYSEKKRLEHTGRRGGPIETRDLKRMSSEELEVIARGGPA